MACFGARSLFATIMKELTLKELCTISSDIVIVEVVKKQSYLNENENRMHTRIDLKIVDKLKGQFEKNDQIGLTVYGGSINGITTVVVGAPVFTTGEKSILFLSERNSNTTGQNYSVVGMGQGKFDIVLDQITNEERIVRNEMGFSLQLEKDGNRMTLSPAEPAKLDDFLDFIRTYIQGNN